MLCLFITLICLLESVASKSSGVSNPLLKLTKSFHDIPTDGTKHIQALLDDLFVNKKLDTFLQTGFEITDGKIEKCVSSHFQGKHVEMYDIKFKTISNLRRHKVTFWLHSYLVDRLFMIDISIDAPSSIITGRFFSEYKYKGSENFTSKISLKNIKLNLRIVGTDWYMQGEKERSQRLDYPVYVKVSKSTVAFYLDNDVADRSSLKKKLVKKLKNSKPFDLVFGNKLTTTTKKCVTQHIEKLITEKIKEWCKLYVDNHALDGHYARISKELINELNRNNLKQHTDV